jgi:membrane protein DedA with SNARE-associated domain
MIESLASFIVDVIDKAGYLGIMFFMMLESTFIPLPSEIVVPPAGYLVYKKEMNMVLVLVSSIIGSVLGALVNYYIAVKYGRAFFIKYGKFILINESKFNKIEKFFQTHGEITTFVGRLLPGVRHYISFPAGLAKMRLFRFCLFTALGAGIWSVILAYLGYFLGMNLYAIKEKLHTIVIVLIPFIAIVIIFYILAYKKYMRWKNNV